MAKYKKTVYIYPQREGEFALDNRRTIYFCKDADAVGEHLEEALWPLLAPALKANTEITITITYKDESCNTQR